MHGSGKEAEHSRPETTARYSRRKADANGMTAAEMLELRVENKVELSNERVMN